jgi:hypothetical protein
MMRNCSPEAGLGGVFTRLNEKGEVAHEEGIEEYALIHRQKSGEALKADAILDYKMVDDDFMLAPVVPHYLLEHADGRARAVDFLARKTASGMRDGDILARNLAFVAERARPFAQQPGYDRLIAFQYGLTVGNWRDSLNGIGGDGSMAMISMPRWCPQPLMLLHAYRQAGC